MSELDKLGKQFDKVGLEAITLDQRMQDYTRIWDTSFQDTISLVRLLKMK